MNTTVTAADIVANKLTYAPATNGFGVNYAGFDFKVIDSGSTANGGSVEDQTANHFTFNVQSTDLTGPKVTGVKLSSNAWTTAFKNFMDPTFGDAANRGYNIPTGANQAAIVPWTNVNRISITFSEDVGASLNLSDFAISGIAGVRPDVTGTFGTSSIPVIQSFTYNATTKTATLFLNQAIEASVVDISVLSTGVFDVSGNRLWGNWTNGSSTISGSTNTPADFSFRFYVLPGDVDRDGDIDGNDQLVIANNGSLIGTIFTGSYNQYRDVDGNASVNANDRLSVKSKVGSALNS